MKNKLVQKGGQAMKTLTLENGIKLVNKDDSRIDIYKCCSCVQFAEACYMWVNHDNSLEIYDTPF